MYHLVPSPCIPHAACSAVSIDDLVYLFGGNNERNLVQAVECFDSRRSIWYEIKTLPNPRSYLQASSLKFPKKFIQQILKISSQ